MTRVSLVAAAAIGLIALQADVLGIQAQEEDAVRVDRRSVNVRENSLGWAEVLGEVTNGSGHIIGRVRVTVTLKDANGKVLDTDYTYVRGVEVEIDGRSDDSGIYPGEHAPFSETFTQTGTDSVHSIEYIVNFDVADPRTDLEDTPILLRISAVDSLAHQNRKLIELLDSKVDSLVSSGGGSGSGLLGDLDSDGDVDFTDFVIFAKSFGKRT